MNKLSLVIASVVALLSGPALAEPTWEDTVDWLKNKFVEYGPYFIQSKEFDGVSFEWRTTSVDSDGCNILIERRERYFSGGKAKEWRTDYVIPVKNYHRLERQNHRNHGYEWIELFSMAKDMQWTNTGAGVREAGVDSNISLYIDVEAYPDFVTRLDGAFKHLSSLAKSNAACGKPEAF